ncbi:MAG TPA: DUF308 domain-containing protein [Patescibacteria group bacterium]|nr:DUF308 domain-containing protein [Patescibacteria group bacterium]
MASVKIEMTKVIRTALIVQGGLAILFGVAAIFWPGLTALVLAWLFAAFLIADGTVLLGVGWTYRQHAGMSLKSTWGALQLLAGIFLLFHPAVTFTVLLLILGISLVFRGVFGLVHAFTHHSEDGSVLTMHGVVGALGIVIGMVVLFQPSVGGLAFVWILGLYALVTGVVLLGLSTVVTAPPVKRSRHTAPPKRHHTAKN